MATIQEIRALVRKSVDWAIQDEPSDSGMRARIFVASLQGYLNDIDPAMAADLERLRYPNGRPSDEKEGA